MNIITKPPFLILHFPKKLKCHASVTLILQFPGIFLAEECSEVTQGGLGKELGAREKKERL